MKRSSTRCQYCDVELTRDAVGLNHKLFGKTKSKERLMCIECMSAVLDCTADDLLEKIEAFKNEGCRLFE